MLPFCIKGDDINARILYRRKYKKYVLLVKPGITGNWAANGRSDTTYDERVMLECQYVNNFSIMNDVKILLKTVISVLKKEGAV